uniref:Integrin alpha-6-like n=1 Tax=Sphaeramia orbicularis TaxID=375764 RepID=A0A673CQ90_9TELE
SAQLRVTCGLFLVFLLGCGRLSAFNLDTDNVLQRDGERGSLFGFSLAMHRQLQPVDKRMLLVGAPRARALSDQKAKVTGGLFTCDVGSTSGGCTRIDFDNEGEIPTQTSESKENQWMGVSVNSQGPGGKIVTCAHRYQRRTGVNTLTESRDIIGRCYVLSQDLTIDPLSGEDGGNWHFCDGRRRGHELFGSCQQGVAAAFDKDFHYIIFGAPGAYNWKGIVRLEQNNNTLIDMGIYDDGPFELGDEKEKNPDDVPVPANSYLGFSLDSGMSLTKKGQLTVVAGAPRANHSGAVLLLKAGPDSSKKMEKEFTLEGEGLASSFGYDVAVLDLNGDGWQDIVVGAPQYFEKDGEIGGAVYVYVNKAGRWAKVKPERIDGQKDSMFGMAVESLGDVNQDGYQDFAVGAPYENNGVGSVYIYHGSDKGLRSKKPAQVSALCVYCIFGLLWLLRRSLDAVFTRARPVISIKKEIKVTPKDIDLTKKNCGNSSCLTVEACFTYTANPKNYSPKLTVAYSLEADADHRSKNLMPRATFPEPSDSDKKYQSKGTVTLEKKGKQHCFKRQLAMQENIRDILHPIPIDVSVDIQDSKRKRRQSASPLTPVLDANEPTTSRSEVHFLKEGCGTDNLCQSNLQVKCVYGHRSTDEDTFTKMKEEKGVPVVSLSDQKVIALEVTVTNHNGDDAHEASLVASFPRALSYSAYRSGPEVNCVANKNGSKVECELGHPFKSNAKTTFYIILGTSGISPKTTELEVDFQLKTTSNQTLTPVKAKAKVAIVLQLSVSGFAQPSQVYFTGEVKGESAMKRESDIGSAITHQFRIINLGKRLTDFGTPSLEIEWPKSTADGKWLLYLTNISSKGVEKMECTHDDVVNPLKLELGNTRTRRAVENTQGREEGVFSRFLDKKSKVLSCKDGAKCEKIKCPLRGMDSTASITLNSRLWNSTFIEVQSCIHSFYVNYMHVMKLRICPRWGKMEVARAWPIPCKAGVRLTVFPERRSAQQGGVPWWIIVLSILLGLLLLALLAFVLWKCGFFKRAKYEDKVPSYNAVRIKREERAINPKNGNWENLEKKPWMTTWHDNEHYS